MCVGLMDDGKMMSRWSGVSKMMVSLILDDECDIDLFDLYLTTF
jgi:hypothetical protein